MYGRGVSEDQAMKVMTTYRRDVPQSPPYTASEVEATVRSRYRRLAPAHRVALPHGR
jgi:hypothetical protein